MCMSLSIMKLAFAENSHVTCFDHASSTEWHDSQLKNREALQSSSISDLFYKLSTQAVTSTGLPTQINCIRVFAKRSLALLLKKRFVKSHQKMSLTHRNRPCRHADYRTTTVRCTQLCSIMSGYCSQVLCSFIYIPSKHLHIKYP